MAIRRMDNVLIVVDDLDVMINFFVALGLQLNGPERVEGRWVEQVIGLEGVRQTVAMLRTPDGRNGVELAQFERPEAVRPSPAIPPVNTLGLRRIMFAVDDIDEVVTGLQAAGAELVGDIVDDGSAYRLCYVRGPEKIIVGLAEEVT